MKEKIKLVIVFVLGIMISVVISVTAATVITAKEVSYTQGTISASNVQDAIDGTYTRANTIASNVTSLTTRVSALESPIEKADFTVASGITKDSSGINKIYYNRITKEVVINFTLISSSGIAAATHVTLCTIPTKYRPSNYIYQSGAAGSQGYSQIRLGSDGLLQFWNPGGTYSPRGTLVYYVD